MPALSAPISLLKNSGRSDRALRRA